ncbi:MAG: hypothetical protein R3Y05_01705 [bacterium]
MFEIKKVTEENYGLAMKFLQNVPSIKDIDEEVLYNASLLYDDTEISGAVAFEKFHSYALVRYFIFKRHIEAEVIKELFLSLEDSAKECNMKFIFSVVTTDDIESLFKELSFKEIDKEKVFIDEENFLKSKFKDTKMMIKELV